MLQRKIVDGKHCYQNGVGPLCFYTPGNKISRDHAKSKAMQFGSSPKTVANFSNIVSVKKLEAATYQFGEFLHTLHGIQNLQQMLKYIQEF